MSDRIETVISEAASTLLGFQTGDLARDILAALKDARIAVVELPKPEDIADEFQFRDSGVRQYAPNGFGAYRFFTLDESPHLAAALLAAVDAAEAQR
ncbi:hypothetical protein A5784_30735 [Mycobacterium sp. 852013-50091_SCH5140682]|uniref:hypothetical protein n=1 Tax=Mycobacterium sp. 852013-50091_SCH5140682 TaxID=1834109 RepID=UPI0007EAAB40|nr:hypothetical protein [Mycobacterium sp. 852013-50091_SCH5140682]OBC14080.1 hypothetical protein A5784_30735 [Mycobacterium sp. 852013-50091_SCH5140682]